MLTLSAALSAQAADVGVSITIGEPGFYGRIDIGDFPRPELVFPQAVIIRPVVNVERAPIHLHVPPGHARDWAKHCHKYGACSERVFFVQDRWYNDVYVPKYKERHGKAKNRPDAGEGKGKGNGNGNGNGKGKHKD
jgi:hypothetical protein